MIPDEASETPRVRMMVCKRCGAVVPYGEAREHTRTHK